MHLPETAPIFFVDFNALMLDGSIILFATEDSRKNIFGNEISIHEGMKVIVYMDDINNLNEEDKLVASGYIIKNPVSSHRVKWCCQMVTDIAYEIEDGNDIPQLLKTLN